MQKGDKYDWKQEDDTYTLTINNPQLDDDGDHCDHSTFTVEENFTFPGTYILLVKEVDAKTSGDLAGCC